MLPHTHKRNESFNSVPVSRVGSSQRLNQISSHSNTSIPSTPMGYVSSSLNPIRNLPVNSGNYKSRITTKEELEKFEKLPIVQQVNEYERLITQLSSSVSSFKEESLVENVRNIININDVLRGKIADLEKHKVLGEEVHKLHDERTMLDNKSRYILTELISYRNELKSLPRLPAKKKAELVTDVGVDVSDVLKYAMKLAKFTKAPASTSGMQFQIHPNNFVWPAEDALRRGMLAASSLQEDEIIKQELGSTPEEIKEEVVVPKEEEQKVDAPIPERRGSFGEYGSNDNKEKEEQSTELNLDLFDPDDEFSD